MLVKGDSRWVTTLHYAFQDEEYLVRILGGARGEHPRDTGEGPWGQGHWAQRPLLGPRDSHFPPSPGLAASCLSPGWELASPELLGDAALPSQSPVGQQ